MSKRKLEQFMSKVADNEELQATIGEKIDAALIALGAECGCEFTADELHEYALDDDGLTFRYFRDSALVHHPNSNYLIVTIACRS